jgi:hypothetical protein
MIFDMMTMRTKPCAEILHLYPHEYLSIRGDFLYNRAIGRCGLVRCDDRAKRDRDLYREATDGNETAAPQCGQCPKFARQRADENRDAALYRCGERGRTTADPDRDSPTRSCDRATPNPSNASQRLGGAYAERRNTAESATLADQRPATRSDLTLSPASGTCRTKPDRGANAPIWPGYLSSATLEVQCL